jgi:hypothetical protein
VRRRALVACYRSSVPGYVYLQAPSMHVQNIPLATYLLTVPGFVYRHSPHRILPRDKIGRKVNIQGWESYSIRTDPLPTWAVTRLEMPLHYRVPIGDAPSGDPPPIRFPAGSWVKITNPGIYKGDTGYVVQCDPDSKKRTVMLVPRIPQTVDDVYYWSDQFSARKRKTTLYHHRAPPSPGLFFHSHACSYADMFGLESPEFSGCAYCDSPTCSHDPRMKKFSFLHDMFQCGFYYADWSLAHITEQTDAIPDDLFQLFAQAAGVLPFLFGGIPPPQSWRFEPGDIVYFSAKSPEDGFRLPPSLFAAGVTGKIRVVYPTCCEVDFDEGTFFIPILVLRKSFEFLDSVLTPSDEPGLVLASSGAPEFQVKVLVEATDVQFHPNKLRYAVAHSSSVQPVSSLGASANPYTTISLASGLTAVWVGVVGSLVSLNVNGEIVVIELDELRRLVAPGTSLPVDTAPVSVNDNDLRTSRAPWLELPVVVTGRHALKGYHGRVKDVRRDESSTVSGLTIRVQFEAGVVSARDQWLDFDDLRQQR